MKRMTYLLAAASALALAAIGSTAAGGVRPDDRSVHGPGAVGLDGASSVVRPDDRAWRGVGSDPTTSTSLPTGIRPDDRATHGPGAVATELDRSLRPDDRAWRGAGPEPSAPTFSAASGDRFDWADAAIGSAGTVGLLLLLLGGSLLLAGRRETALP